MNEKLAQCIKDSPQNNPLQQLLAFVNLFSMLTVCGIFCLSINFVCIYLDGLPGCISPLYKASE